MDPAQRPAEPPGAPTSDVPVPVLSHLASGPTTTTLQRPVPGDRATSLNNITNTQQIPGAPLSPSSAMALFLPYGGRLSRFQREFDSVMHIGSGSFGHVYRARHRVTVASTRSSASLCAILKRGCRSCSGKCARLLACHTLIFVATMALGLNRRGKSSPSSWATTKVLVP